MPFGTANPPQDGIQVHILRAWTGFHELVERVAFRGQQAERPHYIWRGQTDSGWSLSTTLDRLLEGLSLLDGDSREVENVSSNHLKAFKLATRGRRGTNPAVLDELEWWALGQHFGLATPLLDWTRSPYAASYFAFQDLGVASIKYRAVYALDVDEVLRKNDEIAAAESQETGRIPLVQVVDSVSNENPRLVSQGGLFTRAPIGLSIENWVASSFEGSIQPVLIKILVPNRARLQCLRALDRMNITHASLFPDLAGASRATNLKAELYPDILRS